MVHMSYPLSTWVRPMTAWPSALHTVSWMRVASGAVLVTRRRVDAPEGSGTLPSMSTAT